MLHGLRGVNISILQRGGGHVLHSPQGHVFQTLIKGGRRTHNVSALLLVLILSGKQRMDSFC